MTFGTYLSKLFEFRLSIDTSTEIHLSSDLDIVTQLRELKT